MSKHKKTSLFNKHNDVEKSSNAEHKTKKVLLEDVDEVVGGASLENGGNLIQFNIQPPEYGNDSWAKEYKKQFGEDPTFF